MPIFADMKQRTYIAIDLKSFYAFRNPILRPNCGFPINCSDTGSASFPCVS